MATKITLPKAKVLNGGALAQLASDLNFVANPIKGSNNGDIIYYEADQTILEDVLTQSNIELIVAEGGEVEDYLMYAKMPVIYNLTSIYLTEVPEGLPKRTSRASDGTQILEGQVKTLKQWCNNDATQKFSADFQYTYINTSAPGWWMNGSELVVFVAGFGAELLTIKEYNLIKGDLI